MSGLADLRALRERLWILGGKDAVSALKHVDPREIIAAIDGFLEWAAMVSAQREPSIVTATVRSRSDLVRVRHYHATGRTPFVVEDAFVSMGDVASIVVCGYGLEDKVIPVPHVAGTRRILFVPRTGARTFFRDVPDAELDDFMRSLGGIDA